MLVIRGMTVHRQGPGPMNWPVKTIWCQRMALLAGFMMILTAAPVVSAQPLPSLSAKTLAGKKVILPRELNQLSILIVGFSRGARESTQAWAKRLRHDSFVVSRVSVYEVVTLDGMPGFIRAGIVKQLTAGIPKMHHDQFLVVSESAEKLRMFLKTKGDDSAYVVLLTPNGEALWRERGFVTDDAYERLKRAVLRSGE